MTESAEDRRGHPATLERMIPSHDAGERLQIESLMIERLRGEIGKVAQRQVRRSIPERLRKSLSRQRLTSHGDAGSKFLQVRKQSRQKHDLRDVTHDQSEITVEARRVEDRRREDLLLDRRDRSLRSLDIPPGGGRFDHHPAAADEELIAAMTAQPRESRAEPRLAHVDELRGAGDVARTVQGQQDAQQIQVERELLGRHRFRRYSLERLSYCRIVSSAYPPVNEYTTLAPCSLRLRHSGGNSGC